MLVHARGMPGFPEGWGGWHTPVLPCLVLGCGAGWWSSKAHVFVLLSLIIYRWPQTPANLLPQNQSVSECPSV